MVPQTPTPDTPDDAWRTVVENDTAILHAIRRRAEAAEAKLLRVKALHNGQSTPFGPDYCKHCSDAAQQWVRWPCATGEAVAD